MPRIPGINHLAAIRAFEKAGWVVSRQGKHLIMRKGDARLAIPRHNPIHPETMGRIVRDSGLSVGEFKDYLK